MKNLFGTCAVLALAVGSVQAHAQASGQAKPSAQAAEDSDAQSDDLRKIQEATGAASKKEAAGIVVTGSSIRGVAPTGSDVVTLTKDDIKATGANSVTELFSTIPQLSGIGTTNASNSSGSSFNNIAQVSGGQTGAPLGSGTNIVRVGLRQDQGDANGTNTLILIDGNRTSNVGSSQLGPNLNGVPVALLERVDLNLDGASAVYGSDAAGGVINMVTKRRFDGLQVYGKVGFGEQGYMNENAGIIVGHTFGKVSAFVSYDYGTNDMILNGQRPFFKQINFNDGVLRNFQCSSGDGATNTQNVSYETVNPVTGAISNARYYPVNNTNSTISSTGFGLDFPGQNTNAAGAVVPLATSASNLCTPAFSADLQPIDTHHSVLGSIAYDFSDDVKLTVRGRYNFDRITGQGNSSFVYSYNISPLNPFYRAGPAGEANASAPPGGLPAQPFPFAPAAFTSSFGLIPGPYSTAGTQIVNGDWSQIVAPAATRFYNQTDQWGANAELDANLNHNWQLRVTGVYDESRTNSFSPALNSSAITNALDQTNAGTFLALAPGLNLLSSQCASDVLQHLAAASTDCLNPYDLSKTNPALLQTITNWGNERRGSDLIFDAKAVLDGTLFHIPGGAIKVAVGAEFHTETFAAGQFNGVPGGAIVMQSPATENVWALFGEVNIPLVSSANASPFLEELRLSFSGRYDNYDDGIGDTFNPRIGGTYKPFKWLSLRANWGTSFRAPTPIDIQNELPANQSLNVVPTTGFAASFILPGIAGQPGVPQPGPGTSLILGGGTLVGLKPQTSSAWSVGADVTPLPGLRASVNYYHTNYYNQFGTPLTQLLGNNNCSAPVILVCFNPTDAQVQQFVTQQFAGVPVNGTVPTGALTYVLLDGRLRNLAGAEVSGLDYAVKYTRPTGFGSIFASINGTINLESATQLVVGGPFLTNILPGSGPRHQASGNFGFSTGGLRATVTVTHTDGFDVPRSTNLPQDHVNSFNQFALFASYDFQNTEGALKDLELTLGVQNMFNASPPLYELSVGAANGVFGNTIGRVIQLGLQKKF